MREVERREGDLNTMVGLAIIVLLVGTFVAKVFAYWAKARIRL